MKLRALGRGVLRKEREKAAVLARSFMAACKIKVIYWAVQHERILLQAALFI